MALIGALIMMLGSAAYIAIYFFALGLFGLGVLEATLMATTMDSQRTALGSSAALLGAIPLLLSLIATPIAGQLVEISTLYCLISLRIIGPVILGLVYLSSKSAQVYTAVAKTALEDHYAK